MVLFGNLRKKATATPPPPTVKEGEKEGEGGAGEENLDLLGLVIAFDPDEFAAQIAQEEAAEAAAAVEAKKRLLADETSNTSATASTSESIGVSPSSLPPETMALPIALATTVPVPVPTPVQRPISIQKESNHSTPRQSTPDPTSPTPKKKDEDGSSNKGEKKKSKTEKLISSKHSKRSTKKEKKGSMEKEPSRSNESASPQLQQPQHQTTTVTTSKAASESRSPRYDGPDHVVVPSSPPTSVEKESKHKSKSKKDGKKESKKQSKKESSKTRAKNESLEDNKKSKHSIKSSSKHKDKHEKTDLKKDKKGKRASSPNRETLVRTVSEDETLLELMSVDTTPKKPSSSLGPSSKHDKKKEKKDKKRGGKRSPKREVPARTVSEDASFLEIISIDSIPVLADSPASPSRKKKERRSKRRQIPARTASEDGSFLEIISVESNPQAMIDLDHLGDSESESGLFIDNVSIAGSSPKVYTFLEKGKHGFSSASTPSLSPKSRKIDKKSLKNIKACERSPRNDKMPKVSTTKNNILGSCDSVLSLSPESQSSTLMGSFSGIRDNFVPLGSPTPVDKQSAKDVLNETPTEDSNNQQTRFEKHREEQKSANDLINTLYCSQASLSSLNSCDSE